MPQRSAPDGTRGPEAVARAVLSWFHRQHRALPWRASRDPYRIWVAEILLQQTRVEQAAPFFERFVARFPDLPSLARARPSEVLKLWQGAGYYARARRLHQAARAVVSSWGGRLPAAVDELERLPGVGPYTARAVAALAFGTRVVPVDANVLRVVARWTREERDVRARAVRTSLVTYLERALPPDDPGGFAEALMELGETVCRPRAPRCDVCPASFGCRARRELADPSTLPRRPARRRRPHVAAAVVALAHGDRWLVQQRPPSGLLGGLWEFPGGKIEPGETAEVTARRELREEAGALAGPLRALGVVRHGYSHFTVELHIFRATARRLPTPAKCRRWATLEEIRRLPLPRATEKILGLLRSGRPGPATGPGAESRRRTDRGAVRRPSGPSGPPALRGSPRRGP